MEDRFKNIFDNILAPIKDMDYNNLLDQLCIAKYTDLDNTNGIGEKFIYINSHSLPTMIALLGCEQGCIHYSEFRGNYAISFDFTGCAMAKFTLRDHTYFCHIYTSLTAKYDCKTAWNKFLQDNSNDITDLVIFKPYTPRMYETIMGYNKKGIIGFNYLSVLGIIASDGNCYSALMDKRNLMIIPPVAGVTPLYRSYGAINLEEAKKAINYRYQF